MAGAGPDGDRFTVSGRIAREIWLHLTGGGFNVQQLESDLKQHQRSNPEHWGFRHLSKSQETKTSLYRPNLRGQRTDPWGTPHYSPMTGFKPSVDLNIRMLLAVRVTICQSGQTSWCVGCLRRRIVLDLLIFELFPGDFCHHSSE